jgi:unsaturated rhamnogalacturonyl hydrolase
MEIKKNEPMGFKLPDDAAQIARRVADQLLRHPWKLWFWGDSIGLEGLLAATEITGDQKYFGYVYGLLKGWVAREFPRCRFEYAAAGVGLLKVYEATKDEHLFQAACRLADYLSRFRRNEWGAYIRDEGTAADFPPDLPEGVSRKTQWVQRARLVSDGGPFVFVDSMHFDGPFFAYLYRVTGERRYADAAMDNLVPQIELLFDAEAGLFHHFWSESTRQRNGVFWARGNGWGILGLIRTLEQLPPDTPRADRVRSVLQRVGVRVLDLMDRCGGWHTILDSPYTYLETSAGAFFIDALSGAAVHHWIRPDRVRKPLRTAMQFLLANLQPDGVVSGVSHDTFPSTRKEDYAQLPRGAVVPWGQGPLLMALLSYVKLVEG